MTSCCLKDSGHVESKVVHCPSAHNRSGSPSGDTSAMVAKTLGKLDQWSSLKPPAH